MEEFRLPEGFCDRMKKLLGEEWTAFEAAYVNGRYHALRFNPSKVENEDEAVRYSSCCSLQEEEKDEDAEENLEEAAETEENLPAEKTGPVSVPWAKHAYYYGEKARPGKHPYHEMGLYYIQEPSAMSAAALLEVKPGMKVLDLCAAPGGKSTQLLAALEGKGMLVANEIMPNRARILSSNVERLGYGNCLVTNEDSSKMAGFFPSYFHAILVDAPCSGEGMFRKNEEALTEWSLDNVKLCAARQEEILDNAALMLLPGGRMVYSTCTFAPEENEQSIARFLYKHPEFSVVDLEAPYFSKGRPEWAEDLLTQLAEENPGQEDRLATIREELKHTFRLWPHKLCGEGHFVALLQKEGILPSFHPLSTEENGKALSQINEVSSFQAALEKAGKGKKKKDKGKGKTDQALLSPEEKKALLEFLKDSLCKERADWILAGNLLRFGDQLYRLPLEDLSLNGLHVLRPGLAIGAFKKNRFEPSHGLALFLKKEETLCSLDLNWKKEEASVRNFFRGQEISLDAESQLVGEKGWCLVCVDGYPAGWGKLAGSQMKNHYPKGLRREL